MEVRKIDPPFDEAKEKPLVSYRVADCEAVPTFSTVRKSENRQSPFATVHRPIDIRLKSVRRAARGYTPPVAEYGTMRVKTGLAEMLKGGVIMDVVDADQAKIAEEAGACAVMALERVPADIRAEGGVARMTDPQKIREIQEAVSIPVMAKCRIGHFAEAQILEALEVDYIDESEVLTPADVEHHVDKWQLHGAVRLRRDQPRRGAAADRRGRRDDPHEGRGRHRRHRQRRDAHARGLRRHPQAAGAARGRALRGGEGALRAPYELVRWVAENGRLPVVTFTAGGIATPADASLLHAARRGRRVRRLGHLQVWSRPARRPDGWVEDVSRRARRSSRRRRTSTTRRSSPRSPPASVSRWSASPRARSPRSERARSSAAGSGLAVRPSPQRRRDTVAAARRLGSAVVRGPRCAIGVLSAAGRFSEHAARARCASSAPTSSRCGCPSSSTGWTASSSPAARRRRSCVSRAVRPRRGDPCLRRRDLRNLRRHDPARPRAPRRSRTSRSTETPTAARCGASRPTSSSTATSARCEASSSARLACASSAPRVEVLGELDGEPVLVRDGRHARSRRSTPS